MTVTCRHCQRDLINDDGWRIAEETPQLYDFYDPYFCESAGTERHEPMEDR